MEEDLNRHFTKEETQIMANKYIKGCLTILTNRKIEIKPIMIYHYEFTEMLRLNWLAILSAGEDVEEMEFSYTTSGNVKR